MTRFRPEQLREGSLVLIIALLITFFATQIDNYLSGTTFTRISTSFAIVAVLAVGQTLVVLTRNVDLSVGSIVGLIAYGVGTILGTLPDLPPIVVIGMCIAFGALLGAINGVIIAWGRVPAIVTTLGTLAIFRVLLVEMSGSKTVTTFAADVGGRAAKHDPPLDRRARHPSARPHRDRRRNHVPTCPALPTLRATAVRHRL
jgi:rhamnose transport system permease protein